MWKKIVVAGTFAVVVTGGAGAALALSGSTSSSAGSGAGSSATAGPSASPSGPSDKHGEHRKHGGRHAKHGDVLRRALHATWTTKDKDGTVVTHDAIRGTVTAASTSAVTVKAADGVSQTYRITAQTTVRVRPSDGKGKPAKGSASSLKTGQQAVVIGTGTGTLTASTVVTGGK